MKKEYKCAACGETFQEGWSEEEAKSEAEQAFGKPVDEWNDEYMVVCDDCYKKMLPSENPEYVEHAKTII